MANPSGTFTLTEHSIPVRVQRDGHWQPIDTTLARRADGRLGPRAAVTDVTFSAGGNDPLVRLVVQGRSVDIDWPGALPAPVVDGSRVTYPEVMAGVDLTLNADVDGFAQALVVKSAQAAQNPELASIDFALKTTSLTLATTDNGVIEALNPAGQVVLASSTPRMWDSAGDPTAGETPTTSTSAARESSAAAEIPSGLDPGAHSADVDVTIDANQNTLVLKPDQALLAAPDTVFPLYIDPRITGKRTAWTIAYKAHPSSSFWNGTGWGGGTTTQARVGYEKEDGGTGRSFFRIDTRKLAGAQVIEAQFNITETHSWSCSPRPVELWLTTGISAKTTWNNMPTWSKKLDSRNVAHGNETYGCSDAGVDFDATYAAKAAASKKWKNTTFALKATKENDTYAWKKFKTDAKLIVDYNRTPNVPTGVDTVPSTKNSKGTCGATSPHVTLGLTDVKFTAKVKDPDGGTVRARFKIWPSGAGQVAIIDEYVKVSNGSAVLPVKREVFKAAAPKGGNFSWSVLANDTLSSSAWYTVDGAYCHFVFDPVRPASAPEVTSTQFPNGEDGTVGAPARTTGTFVISSGGVKDVVKYYYALDKNPPTELKEPTSAGGSVSVKLTPGSTGPHKVYVYSLDSAKNQSDTEVYPFNAGAGTSTDKPGDVNGDAFPDLYTVTGDQLRLHPGAAATGALQTPLAATAESGWSGALLTHRGDWNDDSIEDLITRRDGTLWMYPTDGLGELVDTERQEFLQFAVSEPDPEDPAPEDPEDPPIEALTRRTTNAAAAAADPDDGLLDLSTINQISSLGDISNDLEAIAPDLVAVVGDQLWYLEGYPGIAIGEAYPIGDSGWSGVTVATAGDHDKDGFIDLFVREKSSGKLWLQRGRPDALDPTRVDPASLGNPANRVLLESSGWSATARPLLTSTGDANGDGVNDLWATDSTGRLLFSRSKPGAAGEAATVIATTGWSGMTAIS